MGFFGIIFWVRVKLHWCALFRIEGMWKEAGQVWDCGCLAAELWLSDNIARWGWPQNYVKKKKKHILEELKKR